MDRIEAIESVLHNVGIAPGATVQIIVAWSIVAAEAESAPDGVVSFTTDRIGDRQIRTPQVKILNMLRKRIVDLTQDGVLAFPICLHHGIAWILNPVAIVARPTDHPIGAPAPVQVIVALRSDQYISKCRPFQKTAGRRSRKAYGFDAGQNPGGPPTRP